MSPAMERAAHGGFTYDVQPDGTLLPFTQDRLSPPPPYLPSLATTGYAVHGSAAVIGPAKRHPNSWAGMAIAVPARRADFVRLVVASEVRQFGCTDDF